MKANGNLSILNLLAKRGSGFDIVSGGRIGASRPYRRAGQSHRVQRRGQNPRRNSCRARVQSEPPAALRESCNSMWNPPRNWMFFSKSPPVAAQLHPRAFPSRESRCEGGRPSAYFHWPVATQIRHALARSASSLSCAPQFETHPLAGNQRPHRFTDCGSGAVPAGAASPRRLSVGFAASKASRLSISISAAASACVIPMKRRFRVEPMRAWSRKPCGLWVLPCCWNRAARSSRLQVFCSPK